MRGAYSPLHVKSDHSPGLGSATVEEIVRRAARDGLSAIALTDVESLAAQVRFHYAARASGVRPITGLELRRGFHPGSTGARDGRIVLLAKNARGYASLCRIVSRRRDLRAPTPPPIDCLASSPEDLFFLSDDPPTLAALRAGGVSTDDLRFLLVRPGGSEPAPPGLGVVADVDAGFLEPEDRPLHDLLTGIRLGRVASAGASGTQELPGPDDWSARFGDLPEALAESRRVAEACSLDLVAWRAAPPRLAAPEGETPFEALDRLVQERFAAGRAAGRWGGEAYVLRLAHELGVIERLALAPWFRIAAAIADDVTSLGLPLLARGSVVGSLVAHVLDFSPVDPVASGLRFERFLNAERRELPDIDLDLPSHRRDEILARLFARCGRDRTAMVAAHATFGRRSAWREGLKALGASPGVIGAFLSGWPPGELEGEIDLPLPLDRLPTRLRANAPTIERLVGRFHHLSVHAGGVVITAEPAASVLPLERAPKGVRVSQYDMHALGRLGFVKIDLLGNRALSAVVAAEHWIGRPVDAGAPDEATLETLRRGDTLGCFQVETPAMRALLRRLALRGRDDLVAALALVRPGPAAGEAKAAFVRRAAGEEPAIPPHPRLATLLAPTFGLLLYEEDLTLAISLFTGWDFARADRLREDVVAAADDAGVRDAVRAEFAIAARATGLTEEEIATAWRSVERFAAYSFHKAHATSYARLVERTAFLKTHHPAAWACGVLNSYGGHYPLRTIAADVVRHGVPLAAPHVGVSGECATLAAGGGIRLGLDAVKGLTRRSATRILAARPFADLAALVTSVRLSTAELEALVLAGACDGLAPLDPAGYPFLHEALLERAAEVREGRIPALRVPEVVGEHADRYRMLVRVRNEIRFLAMHPTAHPMTVLRDEAARAGAVRIVDLAACAGRRVRVAAVVASSRRLAVEGGRLLQFVTLEDESGLVEARLAPPVHAALGDPITHPGPFLVDGHVRVERRDVQLQVAGVLPFHLREGAWAERG